MPEPTPNAPPMGRRERKKQQTRMRILDAALSLIAEHGYDAVKIEDIAARADVANATFFLHFPNKAAIIVAFNEYVSAQIVSRLSGFELPAVEQLEVFRAIALDEWTRHRHLFRQIVSGGESGDRAGLSQTSESLVSLAHAIIRDAQATGELSPSFDPFVAANCLIGGWRAVALAPPPSDDPEWSRRANRQVLDILLTGLTPRPSEE